MASEVTRGQKMGIEAVRMAMLISRMENIKTVGVAHDGSKTGTVPSRRMEIAMTRAIESETVLKRLLVMIKCTSYR